MRRKKTLPTARQWQRSKEGMDMKVKKSDIQLLIGAIGVLLAVCTYFFVYTKFNDKSEALETENATLQSRVATLEILDQKKADYAKSTEDMKQYIANFENRFPAGILPLNIFL